MRRRITDASEGLIRRAWRTGRPKIVVDQVSGAQRAPAAAFELRAAEEALSVNIESSLRSAGLPLTWQVDFNKQYAVRITVGDCSSQGLETYHDPVPPKSPTDPGNPHHGSILGLQSMRATDPDRYEGVIDALAKASRLV
jgi:hypothetical protein